MGKARTAATPGRGGHAPGDLRDAFTEAVDAFIEWEPGQPEPTVELCEQVVPIRQIFGMLWNCSDTLPGVLLDQIVDRDPGGELKRPPMLPPHVFCSAGWDEAGARAT